MIPQALLKRYFKIVLLALCSVALTSCATRFDNPMYATVTRNVGTDYIKHVRIYHSPRAIFDDITPRQPRSYRTEVGDRPVPEFMKISWTLEDGRNFERTVPLRKFIPNYRDFSAVEIQFNGGDIEVFREMRVPGIPLETTKTRIYPN